ncbi:hypothetical protein ACQEVC_17295 [Plantactinospora sp. CA-294935]|uniref:hypothetical protein n=1 Tax=Plantactinospora sp. CA-294935 TaxID=3240012 RepID=UPI003D918EAF
MDRSSVGTARAGGPRWHAVLHRWPSLLGLAVAVPQLVLGADHESVAIVVGVATLCYLGAAAFDRPWVAWAGIPGGSLVIAVSKITGLAWWAGLGIAAVALVLVGLLGRAPRPAFTAQVGALIGYGGLAVATLAVAPRAGLVLAGLLLASHAVWDLVHYRRNQVVPRSLAEFCMLLDVPLGLGVVVLAFLD